MPVLTEGYYLDNFETILTTVCDRYDDLLGPGELAFLGTWRTLDVDTRRLYVRLLSRKGPCLRRDRLDYAEIGDLDAALQRLRLVGLADDGADASPGELLNLLLCDELRLLADELLATAVQPPKTARKKQLCSALTGNLDEPALAAAVRCCIEVVRPLYQPEILVFRLLFFGNLSQDWTELVLRDLGVVRFESYPLSKELRLFPSRKAVDDTLLLGLGRDRIRGLLEEGELAAAVTLGESLLGSRHGYHQLARRHLDRIANRLGRALERAGEYTAALDFYTAAHSPPARERQARVLVRLGCQDEALQLCREIGKTPRDETEVVFAPRFAARLCRQPWPRPQRPVQRLSIDRRDGVAAEQLALDALTAAGRPGIFAENWLWRSLFGLAFWDIIFFAPVAGAFQHPFQYAPLDLYEPEFRPARRRLIEQRLAELVADPQPGRRLLALYDDKLGIANPFVSWHPQARPGLELALSLLTGRQLACVCDRLSRDLRRYRRGFPDLLVVAASEPGFELLEVKAPGDQLRPEQGAWIDFLNRNGLPASVLRLSFRS